MPRRAPAALPIVEMARILLVEDDQDVREMLVDMIAPIGHLVTAVRNGDAALVLLHAGEFDLLITDVRMPGPSTGLRSPVLPGAYARVSG